MTTSDASRFTIGRRWVVPVAGLMAVGAYRAASSAGTVPRDSQRSQSLRQSPTVNNETQVRSIQAAAAGTSTPTPKQLPTLPIFSDFDNTDFITSDPSFSAEVHRGQLDLVSSSDLVCFYRENFHSYPSMSYVFDLNLGSISPGGFFVAMVEMTAESVVAIRIDSGAKKWKASQAEIDGDTLGYETNLIEWTSYGSVNPSNMSIAYHGTLTSVQVTMNGVKGPMMPVSRRLSEFCSVGYGLEYISGSGSSSVSASIGHYSVRSGTS